MTRVSAVVLAWLSEPWLERCVESLLASEGVEVDVVVVDNGCTDGGVERVRGLPSVKVVEPGSNLGFAGGCNLGAAHATGEIIAFVNGDAVVEPNALERLAGAAQQKDVGIACASIRLSGDADKLNSAGNPIHFLGFSWSGGLGEGAEKRAHQLDVAGASGAGMAVRREVWERLGGFEETYFAYHEDAELSLRTWQAGLRVAYVHDAVVVHRYEFSRNPRKYYLMERNRLLLVLTAFQTRTLVLLAPALVGAEAAILFLSALEGWWRQKVWGWAWIIRNARWVIARRRALQSSRTVSDRELARLFSSRLDPGNVRSPWALAIVNTPLSVYWSVVRRLL